MPTTAFAELEIGLHRRDADFYSVELRFTHPNGESDVRLVRSGPPVANFDPDYLRALAPEPTQYGQALGQQLMADSEVLTGILQARAAAQAQDASLRVRLFVGPSTPELHSLHWETLVVPGEDGFLSMSENTLFSRYLSGSDWRPVALRARKDLRALIVVANPDGLSDYGLADVDVDSEIERTRSALGADIVCTELADSAAATLGAIVRHLRDGYDIVYIVAHGTMIDGSPALWLADDEGTATMISGQMLVLRIQELSERPSLVLLASCQSAGDDGAWSSADEGVLAALGPRLVEAGIPAVIAMQGNVRMETMERFFPVFFEELRRDGQVDHAMAAARSEIRDRIDWWAPVLFMRLRRGRIWYTGGFEQEESGLRQWRTVLGNIEDEVCTPIIGSGLFESLLGSRRQIARRWADTYHYPMAQHQREDLPQVAQFLETAESRRTVERELGSYLAQTVAEQIRRERESRPSGNRNEDDDLQPKAKLDDLINLLGEARQQNDRFEPHAVLASLPFRIYITTDTTNLLAGALRSAGKDPRTEFCRWNSRLERIKTVFEAEPDYDPSVDEPLIFQLFGNINRRRSLVLTEDDYFEYLMGVTRNNDLIPLVVRDALADSALLFLGFRLDSWDFRIIFRSLMKQDGPRDRFDEAHVAAQVDPEDGHIIEPNGARYYLKRYFDAENVNIYWGSAGDFVRELQERWEEHGDDPL